MGVEMELEGLKKKIFVSCPFDLLVEKYLPRLLHEGINPEVGLNRGAINRYALPDFVKVADVFREHGVSCTIHAPFTDISMGAIDNVVRAASLQRLTMALDVAAVMRAGSIVMHTGYDYQQYLGGEEEWLENTISSLEFLVGYASKAGTRIFIENVYEPGPEFHRKIFQAIDSPFLGFCLDLGHLNVFSPDSTLEQWLSAVGRRLGELHLHDNRGAEDDHLPIGQGECDFDSLFEWLKEQEKCPVLTAEAHDEEAVIPSLLAVGRLLEKFELCRKG